MVLFKIARLLLSFFRRRIKNFEKEYYLSKKSRTIAREHSQIEYLANILIVKNTKYASLAKICVVSFLHFHPQSHIVIHVDGVTAMEVNQLFSSQIKSGKITIKIVDNDALSWQEQKIRIASGMFRDNEFYMDADLRWNGKLPVLKGLTFFVEEFRFAHRSPYAQMFRDTEFVQFRESTMKNTSFIHFGGSRLLEDDGSRILAIENCIRELTETEVIPKDDREVVFRLREQIAISLFADEIDSKVFFLKEVDGLRDGSFLESSYFGATGSEFEFK